MNSWDKYWYGPVAAIRPHLLVKGFLSLLALDTCLLMLPRGAHYGSGGFNVAHFHWLDVIQPAPTPAIYTGVILLASLLALMVVLNGVNRIALATLCFLYTYGWSMSMRDGYQHHYLISLLLLSLVFFPKISVRDICSSLSDKNVGKGRQGKTEDGGRGRGSWQDGRYTSAWGYVLLAVTAGIVYSFTAIAKMDAEWLGGHTLRSIYGSERGVTPIRAVADWMGISDELFWVLVSAATIAVELAIAAGYLLAPLRDRNPSRLLRLWYGLSWFLAMSLHGGFQIMQLRIGWFSWYMMLLACVVLLPLRWLSLPGMVVARLGIWFDSMLERQRARASGWALRVIWMVAALIVAAALGLFGRWLDLPGATISCSIAGATLLASVVLAVARGATWQISRQVIAFGLAAMVLWIAIANSAVRYSFYRGIGTDEKFLGRASDALTAYLRAERYVPADAMQRAQSCANQGDALTALGRTEEAISYYRKALEVKSDYARAYYRLALALQTQNKFDQAIEHYQKSLEIEPNLADAHYHLGITLRAEGKVAEAIEGYLRAIEISPSFAEAHNNLAIELESSGQVAKAIEHYRLALAARPGFAEVHNNLAIALAAQGQLNEAIIHYREALLIQPEFARAHNNLGWILHNAGWLDEALEHFQAALRLKGDYTGALTGAAWILATHPDVEKREANEALKMALRAAELTHAKNPLILDTLAAALAATDRYDQAIKMAESAAALASSANQAALATQIHSRLQMYNRGKPYHQIARGGENE